ncbi:hypothetical protein BDV38DRAFT_282899 [Aspergillus pseudotamarii]|uniref:Uncharacterized protein n=1 Tax=Aspergillus pseudotamarii TaxID=132259 RepID=A0A5N6SSQ6_ASPPS|nr:uncharacterized protein BDV38DRAFT_282899 [Aspergillus pseudotamarii]KAE8137652.1 hypothetical protein BDV38DRAFT_282899 [Aspergillus pseudotamarii]
MKCSVISESWFKRRPRISIDLSGKKEGSVSSYTTSDKIEGTATIIADRDTPFDHIKITFEGTTRVYIERPASVPRGRYLAAWNTFLRLQHQPDTSLQPNERVFRKGQPVTIPFTFTIPDRLPLQSCEHPVDHGYVHQRHTRLPPTLEDTKAASSSKSTIDNLNPRMCRIEYFVKVAIQRHSVVEPLAARIRKVHLVPVYDEELPLVVCVDKRDYCWRKEVELRRGMLRDRMGRLQMVASQPGPILVTPGCRVSELVSSAATVHIRFDPVGDEPPPLLKCLRTKLKASTFYASYPWTNIPSYSTMSCPHIDAGLFERTIPVSSLCIASVEWEKQELDSSRNINDPTPVLCPRKPMIRDSAVYYTACLTVPITLPRNKMFIPTFHSCFISRTYALEIELFYNTTYASMPTAISLKVPLHITSSRRPENPKHDSFDLAISSLPGESAAQAPGLPMLPGYN